MTNSVACISINLSHEILLHNSSKILPIANFVNAFCNASSNSISRDVPFPLILSRYQSSKSSWYHFFLRGSILNKQFLYFVSCLSFHVALSVVCVSSEILLHLISYLLRLFQGTGTCQVRLFKRFSKLNFSSVIVHGISKF